MGATLAFASASTATKVPSLYGIFDLAALMVYLTAWSIVEKCTRLSDRVTVCRDIDSGVRLAGILTGCGLASGLAMSAVNESPQRLIPAAAALLVLVVLILFVELAVFRSRRLSHELAARRFLSIVAATAYVGLGYFFVISAR